MYNAGTIVNQATGRYHPVVFRECPSGQYDPEGPNRYKSMGHHTEGFDNLDLVLEYFKDNPQFKDSQRFYAWDGQDIPAIQDWFYDKI